MADDAAAELSPMESAYLEEPPAPSLFPRLKERIAGAPPVVRDLRFSLRPRTYHFDRQRDGARSSEATAYGGWLALQTGDWRERVRAKAKLFTTQRAHGPDNRDGTLLLAEGQEGFWVLGEANVQVDLTESLGTTLYRQSLNLPYLNRSDSRMVPNTFEAYTLSKQPDDRWAFLVSHVRQMKLRNSDDFVSMAQAAGFEDEDEPLTVASARVDLAPGLNLGAAYQHAWEFMGTFYGEANAVTRPTEGLALKFGAQYTQQDSVGDEIGGDFDTYVYGGKVAASWRNAILTFAFTRTGDTGIRNPFGGYPGYLSLMIQSFNRAEEDGWLVGLSCDFSPLGLPGLSGFVNYARGDTPDGGGLASPDQEELDITVDYRFQSKALSGLWLRARAATLEQDDDVPGAVDVEDFRLILNYEWPIL